MCKIQIFLSQEFLSLTENMLLRSSQLNQRMNVSSKLEKIVENEENNYVIDIISINYIVL
jgi:hypothetical protein